MSTKTISKRVALATVVALGAGVLSLVSVSSASATANAAVGTAGPTAVAGVMNIGTATNVTGSGVTDVTSLANAGTNSASFGLLSVSDIAGASAGVAGTTQTATLTSSGSLVLYTGTAATGSANANNYAVFVVSGGTISSAAATATTPSIAYNASLTAAAVSSSATTPVGAVIVKPNAGVSTMTVQMYNGSTSTFASATAAANSPTSGTLNGAVTVSIAATSTSGTLSLTNSKIVYNSSTSGSTTEANSVGIGTSDYATVQYAEVILRDAYSVTLPTGGYVTASATNGAYVALATSGAANSNASAGTASTSFMATAGTNMGMTVGAGALAATGGSTVVTVSYNGTVLGTKAFTFTGKIAKVVLTNQSNGVVGGTGTPNQVGLKLYDGSGNAITFASATAGTTAYPLAITKDTNGFKALGAGMGTINLPTSSTGGFITYTCTQTVTDVAQVDYSNADGTVVVSNQAPMSCSGNAYTYTAALDKASYTPGEIATLKVTFKDSTGALANDLATGISGGTTATTPSISGGNLTAVTAPTSTDATVNGVATYKFIVGVSTGSYQLIASFPTVNANAVASAQTVSYKVADGSTSLNDVLKGIVSLIASINKQIAALAKLVTKK